MILYEDEQTSAKNGTCGCVYNWDDKFVERFCAKHETEQEELESRSAWEADEDDRMRRIERAICGLSFLS